MPSEIESLRAQVAALTRAEQLYTEAASAATLQWERRAAKAEAERNAQTQELDRRSTDYALANGEKLRLRDELATTQAERDALAQVIEWTLGERDEFPNWPVTVVITGNPKFWWRTELRQRFDAARRKPKP